MDRSVFMQALLLATTQLYSSITPLEERQFFVEIAFWPDYHSPQQENVEMYFSTAKLNIVN